MSNTVDKVKQNKMAWWREAKYGMFIHWGLYAITAGKWQGQEVPGIGEWIMRRARIPIAEYAQLAAEFNPLKFNAREWVQIAKQSGMKYIVFTAKHHDGFCLYHSKVSSYNIVDATPFGRDPMKELAEACAEAGLFFCFYYSQSQDWYEKDAIGNDWDFPNADEKDFSHYLETKVKPQLKELLTEYGPIGLIWFDTPYTITPEQSRDLYDHVVSLQPNCIVNGRLGGEGGGDYVCLGDNQTPSIAVREDWETCATLNDTWGYKEDDHNWKSSATIVTLLSDIVSKGGTYLLNVGPTAEGLIPQPSVQVLEETGDWLKRNEEAIRGASASPFETEFEWGTVTTKPGKVYIHLYEWPGETFSLNGLKSKVRRAYLLSSPGQWLHVEQSLDTSSYPSLQVSLGAKTVNEPVYILALEVDGDIEADHSLLPRANGSYVLEGHQAMMSTAEGSSMKLSPSGAIANWTNAHDALSWTFDIKQPGAYRIDVISAAEHPRSTLGETSGRWEGGHELHFELQGSSVRVASNCILREDERIVNPRTLYFNRIRSECGQVQIGASGTYELQVRLARQCSETESGIKLVAIHLVPV